MPARPAPLRPQVSKTPFGCQVNGKNFSYPDPEPLVIPVGKVVSGLAVRLLPTPAALVKV